MKVVSYLMMWFGLMAAVWGDDSAQRTTGLWIMGAGFVVYVVVRILDRIDPDGAEDD
jgi:hypothetical protein